MLPSRLSAAVLPVLTTVVFTPAAGALDFGTAELGEVRTACGWVCFGADCSASGTVSTLTVGPPFFARGLRVGEYANHGNFCNNTPGVTTPVSLPRRLDPGQALVFDIDLVPTDLGTVDGVLRVNGSPQADFSAFVVPVGSCQPSDFATCLTDDRFKVRLNWRTQLGTRDSGRVVPVHSDDSGLFYFFSPDNWEVLLKVLDGCPLNSRFWVFSAATTNVEYTLTVTDTQRQVVKTYFNPLGKPAAPVQDTSAFATCP